MLQFRQYDFINIFRIHKLLAIAYTLCMGKLEENSRKRTKRKDLQKIILRTVATAGLLSVVVLAPNALKMFEMFGYKKGKRSNEVIKRARNRLVESGMMKYDGKFFVLTEKGQIKLRLLELHDFNFKKPKKWDKKWRVLIFDIKEQKKYLREKVRNTLRAVGFIRLQDSVWVYPYDCEELIALLKADFKIGRDLLYMIVDEIENDAWLKEQFDL